MRGNRAQKDAAEESEGCKERVSERDAREGVHKGDKGKQERGVRRMQGRGVTMGERGITTREGGVTKGEWGRSPTRGKPTKARERGVPQRDAAAAMQKVPPGIQAMDAIGLFGDGSKGAQGFHHAVDWSLRTREGGRKAVSREEEREGGREAVRRKERRAIDEGRKGVGGGVGTSVGRVLDGGKKQIGEQVRAKVVGDPRLLQIFNAPAPLLSHSFCAPSSPEWAPPGSVRALGHDSQPPPLGL